MFFYRCKEIVVRVKVRLDYQTKLSRWTLSPLGQLIVEKRTAKSVRERAPSVCFLFCISVSRASSCSHVSLFLLLSHWISQIETPAAYLSSQYVSRYRCRCVRLVQQRDRAACRCHSQCYRESSQRLASLPRRQNSRASPLRLIRPIKRGSSLRVVLTDAQERFRLFCAHLVCLSEISCEPQNLVVLIYTLDFIHGLRSVARSR